MCACTCILESTVLLTAREYQTLSKRTLSYAALKGREHQFTADSSASVYKRSEVVRATIWKATICSRRLSGNPEAGYAMTTHTTLTHGGFLISKYTVVWGPRWYHMF